MSRLSTEDRWQAIGMLRAGVAVRELTSRFNCHHSTIVRLNQRHGETGTVDDRSIISQLRSTTAAQGQHIVLTHLRNRFKPLFRHRQQFVEHEDLSAQQQLDVVFMKLG